MVLTREGRCLESADILLVNYEKYYSASSGKYGYYQMTVDTGRYLMIVSYPNFQRRIFEAHLFQINDTIRSDINLLRLDELDSTNQTISIEPYLSPRCLMPMQWNPPPSLLPLPRKNVITIQWSTDLQGDFSFTNNWSYQEGVYKNQFGQLSCDGFCPERTWNMKDEKGKILKDSLDIFYQLVDTTHVKHSIKSEVNMYEYSGINFIEVKRIEDRIKCITLSNASTHSRMMIELINNTCIAKVDFNSIRDLGRHTFRCKKGSILIDKNEWEKGFLKAKFDFTFENNLEKYVLLFWKGMIYAKIE